MLSFRVDDRDAEEAQRWATPSASIANCCVAGAISTTGIGA